MVSENTKYKNPLGRQGVTPDIQVDIQIEVPEVPVVSEDDYMQEIDVQIQDEEEVSESQRILNNISNSQLYQSFDEAGKSTSVNSGQASGIYNQIIYQNFDYKAGQRAQDGNKTENSKSLCSILDDYSWTIDTFVGDIKITDDTIERVSSAPIPHCYLIEYQQKYSSNISNLLNTMVAALSTFNDEGLKQTWGKAMSKFNSLRSSLSAAISRIQAAGGQGSQQEAKPAEEGEQVQSQEERQQEQSQWELYYAQTKQELANMVEGIGATSIDFSKIYASNVVNSKYLAPYKLMYSLQPTHQRYCFPMLSAPPLNKVANAFGDKQESDSIISNLPIFDWITKNSSAFVNVVRDVKDFGNLFFNGGASSKIYEPSYVEKSKFFNYPTNTQEYTISFPLLNTVRTRAGSEPNWKKNYKFILLFGMKNMVFRRDNASYYPPLLYDLVIPGVIRQPFCYISEVSAKPLGIVRQMQMQSPLSFIDRKIAVAVPQAWIITIKVKSLLATTANMVLSGLDELSISAGTQSSTN